MGIRMIVDLSQKVGTFTADTTRYVRTHIKAVDGLLDGSGVLNMSLLPSSLKSGLKPIGGISFNAGTFNSFSHIWTYMSSWNEVITDVASGHYVNIDVGGLFSVPAGYIITNGDDGGASTTGGPTVGVTLEKNDWVVYLGKDESDNKLWQIINNTYPTASADNAGIMSAAMVTKLNGIESGANNYTHPTFSTANIVDLGSNMTIKSITFDNGHISAIETHGIAQANTSQKGLVELLAQGEARSTTIDTTRAATHSTVIDIMKYFEQIKVYSAGANTAANLASANASYEHGEGAFVFIKTGEVEV